MEYTNNWRSTDSIDVLKALERHKEKFGLIRIADITSLDFLNIPVYICLRPRGKTLCVSAGKGLNHIDSIVSAGMESVEIDVAERVEPSEYIHRAYKDIEEENRLSYRLIPSYKQSHFNHDMVVTWMLMEGYKTKKKFMYPACLVSLDKTLLREPINTFPWSSNGLASGMTFEDAFLSGLYEVIERDAWSCWEYFNRVNNIPFKALCEDSIVYKSTNKLIDKIKSAGLDLVINPLETELQIPVYRCLLLNSYDHAGGVSLGFGCHHNSEVALNRAITEAVQARAVYISGARDDIVVNSILKSQNLDIEDYKSNFIPSVHKEYNNTVGSTGDAIMSILDKLRFLDHHEPLVYRFKNDDPFVVVRVVAPSLAPSGARKGLPMSRHPRISSFNPELDSLSNLFASNYK